MLTPAATFTFAMLCSQYRMTETEICTVLRECRADHADTPITVSTVSHVATVVVQRRGLRVA